MKNAQKRDFFKLLKKKSVFDQQINCIYKYEDLVTQPTPDLFHDLLPPIRKTLLRITQQLPPLPSATRRRRWWSPGLSQQGWRRSRDGGAGKAEQQQQQQLRDERREEASRRGAACQRDAIDLTPTEIDSRTGARGTGEGGGWWGSLTRHTHLNSKSCTVGGGGERNTLLAHTQTRYHRGADDRRPGKEQRRKIKKASQQQQQQQHRLSRTGRTSERLQPNHQGSQTILTPNSYSQASQCLRFSCSISVYIYSIL